MKATKVLLILGMLLVIASRCIGATPPKALFYQGKLVDSAGKAVDGTCSIEFRLFAVDTAGTALWSQTQPVAVARGLFTWRSARFRTG